MNLLRNRNNGNSLGFFEDSVFDEFFNSPIFRTESSVMKTDIKKEDGKYVFEIDMPGFEKEDIKISLKDGYLTIATEKKESNDEKDQQGNYLRRERYYGAYSRSFYVGDVNETDINANYKNGILTVDVLDQEIKEDEKIKFIEIK